MRTPRGRARRPRVVAVTATLAVIGIAAGVSVAGARETFTFYSLENGTSPCFSRDASTPCASGQKPEVTVQTGDTVVWDFSGAVPTQQYHNAASDGSTPANAAWNARPRLNIQVGGTQQWSFGEAGRYEFVCAVHPSMVGTVIVEGTPVETPTPTATPTQTATPTATATPTFAATVPPTVTVTPDDHLTTPAPGKGARRDIEAPRLLRAKVKTASRGAKLSFWVSEAANIEVVARRGKSVVTSARLHVASGTRSVVLRSSSLRKRGSYSVEWVAVDAMANKGNVVKKTLKVKR